MLVLLLSLACNYDFGDCYSLYTSGGFPVSDPADRKTGRWLVDADGFTTHDACMDCDAKCQEALEGEWEVADSSGDYPRDYSIRCGPMWIDGECVYIVDITDVVEGDTGWHGPSREAPVAGCKLPR
jgi:hypothetical protein